MQPMRQLIGDLRRLVGRSDRLFALSDLRALLPEHSDGALKSVVGRLERGGELVRVCRGIYMLPDVALRGSELLGHAAARLRADRFNYLSLETVLSAAGAISQVPMGRITVISSGRSSIIACGVYGTIEFVHTRRTASELAAELCYDSEHGLWRASLRLALRDMRRTRRDTGLVNWEETNESV
ncbi:MAG: hypothetical protein HN849_24710 [Victivallales bacterium]|nr:hypothetical protein [Victivallales bacterium]MBT7162767.1 hypothetical protein [Victivallales bacterium]MBT7302755.1 hypothetical protein [Victivallales bacterium]